MASRVERIPAQRARGSTRLDELRASNGKGGRLLPGHREPGAASGLGIRIGVVGKAEQLVGLFVAFGAIDLVRDEDDAVRLVVIGDAERADDEIGLGEGLESELIARRQLAGPFELAEHAAEEARQTRTPVPSRASMS